MRRRQSGSMPSSPPTPQPLPSRNSNNSVTPGVAIALT
ncbi:hypothetical protein ACJ73_00412 [Blastomyces percursus]|uniref:Uncharacterized protein n=1 Tax=Blastomyces percursus TaxID=1658174 RepID=A0A1J9RHZ7_9EURO|nr:hypothetical protein ACJ73_00412 [Blastomyces percursus]